VTGFKGSCRGTSNAVDETNDDMLWIASEEDGNVRNECVWKMKALTVRMETVTQIGKGRCNLYEINCKIFFLSRLLFLGVVLDLDNTFSLGRHVLFGGHLGLELSCILVNAVL